MQGDRKEINQIPLKPAPFSRRSNEPDKIVDAEYGPANIQDKFVILVVAPTRIRHDLRRIGNQENDGNNHERPLHCPLPFFMHVIFIHVYTKSGGGAAPQLRPHDITSTITQARTLT